jgi:hypothetical protein
MNGIISQARSGTADTSLLALSSFCLVPNQDGKTSGTLSRRQDPGS